MGLIFVFVTMSSPLHAQAMPAASQIMPAMAHADGMSDACAKAMAAQAAKVKPQKPAPAGHFGGCCSNGCNCPLSHCPATPPLLAAEVRAPVHAGTTVFSGRDVQPFVSLYTDTLIRPPRA